MPVATRTLTLHVEKRDLRVEVTISPPRAEPDGSWSCIYSIGCPSQPRTGKAVGIDAVQALQLALQLVGAELYASPYHASGQLCWERPGQGYGFPVPQTIRDMLVGEDSRYPDG